MNRKSQFTTEQESIMARVEIILDTGLPLDRLIGETGIPEAHIKRLMDRYNIGFKSTDLRHQEEAFDAMKEWLEMYESESLPNSFAQTPTFKKIQAIISNAHRTRDFVAITGEVGIGKSQAAIAYVKDHPRGFNKPGAIRVEFTRADRNDSAALYTILSALIGEVEASRSAYRNGHLMAAISRVLNIRDCLILDECNYLGAAADIVRDIYDRTGAAMVMIGNPELSNTVWSKKKQDFSALASRATRFDFQRTVEQDVEEFLTWKGITGARLRKIAVDIASRPGPAGGLRTLNKILELRERYYPGVNLDADAFIELGKQIGRV